MSFSKALMRTGVEMFVWICRLPYAFTVKMRGTYDSQILYKRSICNNNELKIVTKLTPGNNVLLSSDKFTFLLNVFSLKLYCDIFWIWLANIFFVFVFSLKIKLEDFFSSVLSLFSVQKPHSWFFFFPLLFFSLVKLCTI